jgi:hypothetical protein
MENVMDEDGLGITLKQPLRLHLTLCDDKGEVLYQIDEVDIEPGTEVVLKYPLEGIRVTMS